MSKVVIKLLIGLIWVILSFTSNAQQKEVSPIDKLLNEIKLIETNLASKRIDISGLGKTIKTLTSLKATAEECVAEYEKKVIEKKTALEGLGEKKRKESPEVVKQRKQQQQDLSDAETGLAACNTAALRIQAALEVADKRLQKQLAKKLLLRGDHIFKVIALNMEHPVSWVTNTSSYLIKHGWLINAKVNEILILISVIILSIMAGVAVRRFVTPVVSSVHWSSEPSGCFASSVLGTFCHDAPYLFASAAMSICLYIFTNEIKLQPVITSLAYGLSLLFLARYVIHVSLTPHAPGKLFLNIEPDTAKALASRLHVLVVIMFIGYLLVNTLIGSSLPHYAMSLTRSIIGVVFAINLIWVLWLFGDMQGMFKQKWFRMSLSFVLVVAVLVDLIGYNNLSAWLLRSVFGSLLAILITLNLGSLTSDLLEGLEYGHTSWQRRLRRLVGLASEGHITGFFWFRLLITIGWWSLLVLMLIFIWDLSASVVEEIKVVFTSGFTVGSLKVIPARIVLALVTLGVSVALSVWFQGQMRKHWVRKMPMERGARESMVTMIGYLGITIAVLITLGVAGIDFANLAIIAGALSLGIGFGLQNIVNNFVSGLILLFERPVKTGDWIVVGNTEGYVKRIRIRATQIQTFDRADVIVPNSELISGQVTNWMLHDPRGRARIPIGVAYGSDTQQVKDVLLQVANEHPDVITNGSAPEPKVIFRQFGDSSLDFELRCHIENVDNRINVISDLNFAIDAAFRKHGIEIPFPQRDLHIKNWQGKDI